MTKGKNKAFKRRALRRREKQAKSLPTQGKMLGAYCRYGWGDAHYHPQDFRDE